MNDLKSSLAVSSQSNCTSLPDSLNYINNSSSENTSRNDLTPHTQNHQSGLMMRIPSIVICSNENDAANNSPNSVVTEKLTTITAAAAATLPLVSSRRLSNKRATSLLVRFNNNDEKLAKLSKLERIKMKIYDGKQHKTSDTGNSNTNIITDPNVVGNQTPIKNGSILSCSRKNRDETESTENTTQFEAKTYDLNETPTREVRFNDQLIRSLTKPFRRQANK